MVSFRFCRSAIIGVVPLPVLGGRDSLFGPSESSVVFSETGKREPPELEILVPEVNSPKFVCLEDLCTHFTAENIRSDVVLAI